MITYRNRCLICATEFESQQPISDDSRPPCPEPDCQGPSQRIPTPGSGFALNGRGWGRDGYNKS